MPNLEQPASPQESSVEQKKQALAEALAAGDYDKVAALAQEVKGMEAASEAPIETADAAPAESPEAKAQKDAERAEQARLQSEKDSQEAAALLAKMTGEQNKTSELPKGTTTIKMNGVTYGFYEGSKLDAKNGREGQDRYFEIKDGVTTDVTNALDTYARRDAFAALLQGRF